MAEKSEISIAIAGIGIAAIVSTALAPGDFSLWSTIIGLILITLLLAFGSPRKELIMFRTAYCMIFGFCLLLITGFVWEPFFKLLNWKGQSCLGVTERRDIAFFGTWILLSLIGLGVRTK
jgi:hypothetical protein